MSLETLSSNLCFGGTQGTYAHESTRCRCTMRFSVFTPPAARHDKVPVLWFLSGLTCTEENATVKSGFQRVAAELGLMVICPDTSPRGEDVADDDAYDLGQGAGFYVDATQSPWAGHFQMYSYITDELPELIGTEFAADMGRQGITGHSMGGHGALTLFLKNPGRYRSVSAFAPIVAPSQVPWGQKALSAYLGGDQSDWEAHDACALIRAGGDRSGEPEILVDQGLADIFLEEQLQPQRLESACQEAGQALNLRRHEAYDHSYFFIASFMEEHLRHHARTLFS